MSAAPPAALPQARWRAPAGGLPAALTPMLVIGLAAILLQWRFGLLGDVSWLITVDEKWLDGATPYRDVIEINPPASLMLYWPAVALARVLGVAPEFIVAAFGFLSIAAGLGLAAAILARAGLLDRLGALGAAVALVAFAVLPGQSFDERDHLAAVYGLPFLAVAAARAARAPLDARLALLAGLGAGLMAAIKPPYALVAIVLLPYLVRRAGIVPLMKAVEYYAAAAVGLAYLAFVPRAFPHYVADILPLGLDVYAPIREPIAALLASPGPLFAFVLAVCALRLARDDPGEPLVAVPALAGLGALAAYLVQGKGWLYQAYPALAFFSLAAGAALTRFAQPKPRLALGALVFLAAALGFVALGHWPSPLAFVAAGIGVALAWGLEWRKAGAAPIAEMGVAAALGAACGLFAMDGIETPAIARALASLGPHPTVASLSESLAFGHPMVRQVGGVWVQSVPSLWIAAAARRRIDEHPGDAALAQRMRVYIDADRDRLVADLARNRPDALLVGRLDTRFHQWLWNDPEVAAARAGYRLYADETDAGFPAQLWVRADLFGLRPALPGGELGEP
jgi:hypothetical protein